MYEIRSGTLVFVRHGQVKNYLNASENLAILIQANQDCATIVRHGNENNVRYEHETLIYHFSISNIYDELILISLPVRSLKAEMISEINECLECPGQAAEFRNRLLNMVSSELETF